MAGFTGTCYLDNSATTRPYDEVTEAVSAAMAGLYYNPAAAYAPALAVEDAAEAARNALLSALGGQGSVVFTSGGTESDNLAVLGSAGRGGRVITSAVEHPAVARAVEALGADRCETITLPVDGRGYVSADALLEAVDERTKLVSIVHVNSETGTVQDVAALAAAVRRKNPSAVFHSDGVQAFLRVPADPARWGVGLYSVSAHKVHGPKGVGALYIGRGVRLGPRALGGGQEGGLRSGTLNVPGIVGFGRAVELFLKDAERKRAALMEMKLALAGRLLALEGAAVNGPAPESGAPHILNLSFEGVQGEVLLRALSEQGVYVSTGSACGARQRKPSAILAAMGLDAGRIGSAIRLSLSPMNSMGDVDRASEVILAQVKRLRAFKRR